MRRRTPRRIALAALLGLVVFETACPGMFRRHERREERYDRRDDRQDDRQDRRDDRQDDRRERWD